MIVNGTEITTEVLAEVRKGVEQLPHTPVVRAVTVAPSPATLSYLRIKQKKAAEAGMILETIQLQEDSGTDEVIHAVLTEGADAVIVQLPLPASIDTHEVLQSIPIQKDADILSDKAKEAFKNGQGLLPPVVGAVKEILERAAVSVAGKKAYVLGKGQLVGVPVSQWLITSGAEVTILGKENTDLSVLTEADIIVSGVGQAGLIKKEYLQTGVVLIDAGTSESEGSIVGDMDPNCSEVASVFTPVPGGVGPVAVAYLFKNVLELMKSE